MDWAVCGKLEDYTSLNQRPDGVKSCGRAVWYRANPGPAAAAFLGFAKCCSAGPQRIRKGAATNRLCDKNISAREMTQQLGA
jgi:hypothetical protein